MKFLSVVATTAPILCRISASSTLKTKGAIFGASRFDKPSETDLDAAIEMDNLQTFQALTWKTRSLSFFSRDELCEAVEAQSISLVKEMLKNKATRGCESALETAVEIGNLEILEMLLQDRRFQKFMPTTFITAAGNPEPAVLAHLFAKHFHKISLENEYTLLESMIVSCAEDDLVANAHLILHSFPSKDVMSISPLKILDYCEEAEAWKVLGALMAARHLHPYVVDGDEEVDNNLEDDIPNLLLGLNRLLISHAEDNYEGHMFELDPQDRLDTVYSLGQDSEAAADYLESFWKTWGGLPEDLKCNDWLMDWTIQYGLNNHQIMAIGKAISIPLSGDCTQAELLQAARNAIKF